MPDWPINPIKKRWYGQNTPDWAINPIKKRWYGQKTQTIHITNNDDLYFIGKSNTSQKMPDWAINPKLKRS